MMPFRSLPALLAAVVMAAPSFASAPPAPVRQYWVSLKIFDGERLIGQPNLTTYAEEAATFVSRDKARSLEVIAFPKRDGSVHVNASLLRWTPKGLIGNDQAAILASDGEPAMLTLDDFATTGRMSAGYRIEVKVQPVR
jgi:hypothetical protein